MSSNARTEKRARARARTHAHALVAAKVRQARTSFYWGMRILPKMQRQALFAVYAFCREIDDIGDGEGDRQSRLAALDQWSKDVQGLYDPQPRDGVLLALAEAVDTFALPCSDMLAVIEGVRMDVRTCIRAPGLDELEVYCSRVAGAVGLLVSAVLGERTAHGRTHALVLGKAFQLTNILRDLDEDAARGRLYLPREDLFANDIWDTHPDTVLADPAINAVCSKLAVRAQEAFDQADRLAQKCDRKVLTGAFIMRDIYYKLLSNLVRRGWGASTRSQSVRLTSWQKTTMMLRRWMTG